MALPAFAAKPWQMSYGERSAFEGILVQVNRGWPWRPVPRGSIRRITGHSDEVHSFDLVARPDDLTHRECLLSHR